MKNRSSSSKFLWIVALLCVLGLTSFLLTSDESVALADLSEQPNATLAVGSDEIVPTIENSVERSKDASRGEGSSLKLSQLGRERQLLSYSTDLLAETFTVDAGGRTNVLRLALDEAVVRDADGREVFMSLEPAATIDTLPERLAALEELGRVFPVAYLEGRDRSPATRRIITPEIRVQLSGADAQGLAEFVGLTVTDRPDYAPDWVILSAEDSFAALAATEQVRAMSGIASADVLLGKQQFKRALPNDTLIGDQWHLDNSNSTRTHVNVENAWDYAGGNGVRGSGIRIGIVDDGLQTGHPDFAGNVDTANDWDWNQDDGDPNPFFSDDDHGTACAGVAAARGNNNLGVSGVAPEATLVGMRLVAGFVTDAEEAEAMAHRNDIIQVKSNSWGPFDDAETKEAPGSITTSAFATATASGRGGLGTIFVWAGGNGGSANDNSNYDGYANSIYTIAIGASDSSGNRAFYSEPGANIVVVAPSDGASLAITTVDRTGSNGYASGDYTDDFGGTSSATPAAAGVVALMLEENPNLGWRDVQEILIGSAFKIRPSDSDWTDNPAGFHFNHDFGAGLVDATEAVNLASTWTNLGAQLSGVSTQSGLSVSIPNNNSTGITRNFDLTGSNIRVEHVTVELDISHSARGNLEITLTSPNGMESRLAEVHSDTNNNYSNWTFSSVRHWGESSEGVWMLKIADRSNSGNSNGGTLTSAELTVFGAADTPVNPGPTTAITSPADNQIFSTGATVNVVVTASDLDANGDPGAVTSVELFANGQSLGTDTSAPYNFSWQPQDGAYALVATATDSEGATSDSATVNISVLNQPPAITAASLNVSGSVYSDEDLEVVSVTASDPEGGTPTILYQWQSSTDGVTFTDAPSETTALLPASSISAGELWRCEVSASDGNSTSEAFFTDEINVLNRPVTDASPGDSYSHTSGLVLRGTETTLSRPAIINEFSQGPSGGSSEWIELLTLENTSLAFWDIQDAAGNLLVFLDDPVWDNIPAGTLIVIYNGGNKDPLLPADDLDPSDGVMIVSSTNASYFDSFFDDWPSLGNSGDAIFLNDRDSNEVHSLAYGSSNATTPQIGSVGSGNAAYYTAGTDEGADLAANWTTTVSNVARKIPRALGDLFISEYVEGSSSNKALEFYNPAGASVDLSGEVYMLEVYANGGSSPNSTIALTGTVSAGGTFVIKNSNASAGIVAQQTSGSLSFNGDDAVVLKKSGVVVDSIGQVGFDPGSTWSSGGVSTVNQTLRRIPSVSAGDTTVNDAFDPSVEWSSFSQDDFTGLGSHTIAEGDPALTVAISPSSFDEDAGAVAASGTVSVAEAPVSNLTVSLTSSDTDEATVPASVTILAGTTSIGFDVDAVDDLVQDGSQSVAITATAQGYDDGTTNITVTDNEAPLEGVTPGAGNTAANLDFVNALRNGLLNVPALFRLGSGANVPVGLNLDVNTGVLSGTIDPTNPAGDYQIIIERYNSLSEVVTESFVLALAAGGAFSDWISGYSVGSENGIADDTDFDRLPHGIENLLGTSPDTFSEGLTDLNAGANTLTFRHTLSNSPASDLTLAYRWSKDLNSWHASGDTSDGTTVTFVQSVIDDNDAPQNDVVEVTATVTGDGPLFVRLVAIQD